MLVFLVLAGNSFFGVTYVHSVQYSCAVVFLKNYVLRVPYSCGVALVFRFWREIVFGVLYVLSVQYSCAVVSVFSLWREIVLKMRTRFYKKILLVYFL